MDHDDSEAARAERALRGIGAAPEAPFDLAEAALALAVLARPDLEPAPYRRHLAEIARQVAHNAPPPTGRGDALRLQAAALNAALVDRFGYEGDRDTYDDLANADLARVIERRRGLPVALGILWLHGARAQGWNAVGLSFPGHFLLRLGDGPGAAILDPFDGGRLHDAASLRRLLKATLGTEAELAPAHYAGVGDRDVLLRLENNVKLRLLRDGRLAEAAAVLERMLLFMPDRAGLWREAGLVNARIGNLRQARAALETFLALAPRPEERRQAAQILRDLTSRLN